jgi:inorganic pyrophosphatase/K(+)-stimulated pyrophosphate-energized sodium pump
MKFWESGCGWIGKLRWQRAAAIGMVTMVVMSVLATSVFAAETTNDATEFSSKEKLYWGICLAASLAALAQAWVFFRWMMARDEGNETMIELAGHVRDGASAYLAQQYKVVIVFFGVIFAFLCLAAFALKVQSEYVPFAFVTGGMFSGLAGFFGMKTATWASSRTAAGAQKSLNEGLKVAFRSGAVMGLTVVGLALLDIVIWYAILAWGVGLELETITVTMLCFGMGASSQALFARVGGGIFTKAADVGADLVGKVEQGIPEDDPRNPATIADNVGDNVGDVAGMGADLYESYSGSILATAALGVAAFSGNIDHQLAALFLPMCIAAMGVFLSIGGIYLIKSDDNASQSALLKSLGRGINAATVAVAIGAVFLSRSMMPEDNWMIAFSVIVGLGAGWFIGWWTEYVTSDEFAPTRGLSESAQMGPANVIIRGLADGMQSVWLPVLIVCAATLLAFGFATGFDFKDVSKFTLGLYGVGIAAVGMLSTLGITLATDAYGPIADNAGGNAEMAGLDSIVRDRTDALDSLGNTTAATGKGFAIGSAALTALALLAAYMEQVRVGFDRWAEEVVVAEHEDGWYKVNDQFLILHENNEKNEHENTSWLMFPDEVNSKKGRYWTDIKKNTDTPLTSVALSLGLPDGTTMALADAVNADLPEEGLITLNAGSGTRPITLVRRDKATLPDFARYYDASLLNPKILVGVFIGCMATFVFCAMTMNAVGRAAGGMVEEVRRQFKENPGIMDYSVKPDYATPVRISTLAAQKEMIAPSLLGLLTPIATGLILGVGGVMGLLVGTMTCGFCLAIFMSNSGGAWDNAKKYIETGKFGGKGSDAHKAGVVGDTVGDPFKDTSGPSLNILIKLMSMVSVVVAGLIVRYSLTALEIF